MASLIYCETCKGEGRILVERPGWEPSNQNCPDCHEFTETKALKLPIDERSETTKVKYLIEALKKCNPEALVYTEGCDCTGDAVAISGNQKEILIHRETE